MTTEYLLEEQVERVLMLLTPENRLAMRVALQTGLRISDVLSIKKSDIDKGAQFWVTEEKTGKRRKVSLPHGLWRELCPLCEQDRLSRSGCGHNVYVYDHCEALRS